MRGEGACNSHLSGHRTLSLTRPGFECVTAAARFRTDCTVTKRIKYIWKKTTRFRYRL